MKIRDYLHFVRTFFFVTTVKGGHTRQKTRMSSFMVIVDVTDQISVATFLVKENKMRMTQGPEMTVPVSEKEDTVKVTLKQSL